MTTDRMQSGFWAVLILLTVALVATPQPAAADALGAAKAAGQVGERYDGYLGAVKSSPSAATKKLIADINAKRKKKYAGIAKKNGTTTEAVAAVAGKKLIKRAASGQYVMPPSGSWVRR